MNIHIKSLPSQMPYDPSHVRKIVELIYQYDCQRHVYFMTGDDDLMGMLKEMAPDICRCMGGGNDKWGIVERAIRYDCKKVQLVKPYFDQAMIDKAHAHGIRCNVFWSDDPAETEAFLRMGIDTILTNDYHRIARVVKAFR